MSDDVEVPDDDLLSDYVDGVVSLIEEHGWACQGVLGDTPSEVFTYTVGLTLRGLPELWLSGLHPRQATPILNGAAAFALEAGGVPVGPLELDYSVGFRVESPVPASVGEANVATALFTAADVEVRLAQVLWPDDAGRFPDDPGYDTERFPQQLLSGATMPGMSENQPEAPEPSDDPAGAPGPDQTEVPVERPAKEETSVEVDTDAVNPSARPEQ